MTVERRENEAASQWGGVLQFHVYRVEDVEDQGQAHLPITTLKFKWRKTALLALFKLLDEEVPEKAINLFDRKLLKAQKLHGKSRYGVFDTKAGVFILTVEAGTAREAALQALATMPPNEVETALNLLGWVMVARGSREGGPGGG